MDGSLLIDGHEDLGLHVVVRVHVNLREEHLDVNRELVEIDPQIFDLELGEASQLDVGRDSPEGVKVREGYLLDVERLQRWHRELRDAGLEPWHQVPHALHDTFVELGIFATAHLDVGRCNLVA